MEERRKQGGVEEGGDKKTKKMTEIVATDIVASLLPEQQPTAMPNACAKILKTQPNSTQSNSNQVTQLRTPNPNQTWLN